MLKPDHRTRDGVAERSQRLRAELSQLQEFLQFARSQGDIRALRRSDPAKAEVFSYITDQYTELHNDLPPDSKVGLSSASLVEQRIREIEGVLAKLEDGETAPKPEINPRLQLYRDNVRRIQDLLDFDETGADWVRLGVTDPERDATLRHTYATIDHIWKTDPLYKDKGLQFRDVALALIKRFNAKAAALEAEQPQPRQLKEVTRAETAPRVIRPHELFTRARLFLPGEVPQEWQIIKLNASKRTYMVCRQTDRRSPSDIIADIISGRKFAGQTSGYELSWEDFERYNQAAGSTRQTEVA